MTPAIDPGDSAAIYDKLLEAIEENGSVTDAERRKLMLLALTGLFSMVLPLPKKIDALERKNIMMWIDSNPKAASLLAVTSILVAMFFHQIAPWVIDHLALLAGIKTP